jgi:hypothetical protein
VKWEQVAISHHADNAPLAAVLDGMLEPHQLVWITRHDVVLVTTPKAAADEYYDLRVYRIAGNVPVERRMRSVQWNVAPDSWATVGGKGEIAALPPRMLVVYQSAWRHREIARMFARSILPVEAEPAAADHAGGIETTLAAPAILDFQTVHLADALAQLARAHAVKIVLDQQAIEQSGLDIGDAHITLPAGKVRSLAAGLSLLLEASDAELEWLVKDGAVVVTTRNAAAEDSVRATYDMKDILPEGGIDRLTEAIQYTVSAASWEDVGGDGTIKAVPENVRLEVLQSAPVHRQLRRLFADLRAGSRMK